MTNYLKKLLDNNWNVVVKDKDNYYQVFSPKNNGHKTSGWNISVEVAKMCSGDFKGYENEELEQDSKADNWQIVEVYRNTPPIMKVGQKVEILDTIKQTDYWDNDFDEMKGEITRVNNHMIGLFYLVKIDDIEHTIGAEYLIPAKEEMP